MLKEEDFDKIGEALSGYNDDPDDPSASTAADELQRPQQQFGQAPNSHSIGNSRA